jgi:hypothetical protein
MTIGLDIKAPNGRRQITNCSHVSLPERPRTTDRLTCNSVSSLANKLAHFHKHSDGFTGSGTVVFHVKTKVGQEDCPRILRMEFAGTWRSFLSRPLRDGRSSSLPRFL